MAGGTKRMSADEKRNVILQIYHQSKAVYTEKEILTLAAKAGVNANTVADINQSLVDDGLVDKEKIGGSNYFWSFPAKKDYQMQMHHEKMIKDIDVLQRSIQEATVRLADAKRGREDATTEKDGDNEGGDGKDNDQDATNEGTTLSRAAKLQRLQEIEREIKNGEAELEILKENDPQVLADLEKVLQMVQSAANRWTDNIFECKRYLTKKRGMDRKEACKLLGITDAFDYPEDKIPK